jgi:hypothetical protein
MIATYLNRYQKYLIITLWAVVSISLTLYSFTQVDLGLTLTQLPIWQGIQKSFQHIGYYDRELSVQIYISILIGFFILYAYTLYLTKKKKISRSLLLIIILLVTSILVLSYNAFSYDIFNYIFWLKTITFYHQNPYIMTALDFPADPMNYHMRWRESTYPYGPVWLILYVPITIMAFNKFLITFYLIKITTALFFLSSLFVIEKIAKKTKVIDPLFAVAFFALNPLVLIESLVSAHNDIIMMFFVLVAVYFIISGKYFHSIIFYIISVLTKFATIFAFPIYFYHFFKKRNILYFNFIILCTIPAVILASLRTNYQPWYLMYMLPFITFRSNKNYFLIPSIIFSFGGLLIYSAYIALGDLNSFGLLMIQVINYTTFITAGIFLIIYLIVLLIKRRNKKRKF